MRDHSYREGHNVNIVLMQAKIISMVKKLDLFTLTLASATSTTTLTSKWGQFLTLSPTHRVNGSLPFSQTLRGKDDIHIATLRIHDQLLSKFCECMTHLSD